MCEATARKREHLLGEAELFISENDDIDSSSSISKELINRFFVPGGWGVPN
jgi:hypothetical protein